MFISILLIQYIKNNNYKYLKIIVIMLNFLYKKYLILRRIFYSENINKIIIKIYLISFFLSCIFFFFHNTYIYGPYFY